MSQLELDNSAPLNGEPIFVLGDSMARVKALWLPRAELFRPTPLRHVSSTALIHGSSPGQIWVISLTNATWNRALVTKADRYLTDKFEAVSWEHLEGGLSEALEHPLILHKTCLLDDQLSIFEIPRLADALWRRWLTLQETPPEIDVLRRMKADLICQIHRSADIALAEFMRLVDPAVASASRQAGLHLPLHNYLNASRHQRARVQFAKAFPWLMDLVCSSPPKSLWRELGHNVDDLRSPVLFLSKELAISTAAVRALNGVATTDVGPYFHQHPVELLKLLDALPKEFLPKFPEHWLHLQGDHDAAKKFFGRSPAAAVLIRARLTHSLRYAVQFNHTDVLLKEGEVGRFERLRTGMVHATYFSYGVENDNALGIQRRARMTQHIDQFLGHQTWTRLAVLSRKWEKCYAEAVERNAAAIDFISSSHSLFDFCPNGKYVTPNGWSIQCLTSATELKRHGEKLLNCLARAGHRTVFQEACVQGKSAIFAVRDPHGEVRSTAEFHISMDKATTKDGVVRFELAQHTARENAQPDALTVAALQSMRGQFATSAWQAHARNGMRLSYLRSSFNNQDAGISATQYLTSQEAFRATFKDKADELLERFSSE